MSTKNVLVTGLCLQVTGESSDFLSVAQETLKGDYTVVLAPSASEAQERASEDTQFDLVLIGLDTENISGFELLKALKTLAGTRNASFIFVTSRGDNKAEILALRSGIVDYIRLPIPRTLFKARIDARANITIRLSANESDEKTDAKASIFLKLKDFVNSYAGGDAIAEKSSRLHVINLDPVREVLAGRWDKIGQKVIFVVETMVSASVSHGEAYRYFGENIFAVVYPSLTPAEGKIRVHALVEKIGNRLLGQEFGSGRYGEDFIERVLSFDYVEEDTAAHEREEGRRKRNSDVKAKIFSEINVEYIPIWNKEKQTVLGYRSSFVRKEHNRVVSGKNVLHGGASDPLWPDLYALMIRDIVAKARAIETNIPFFVITFDFNAIMAKNFIQKIEQELRESAIRRNLYVELVGLDDHVNKNTIKALLMMLRNFFHVIIVRISPESTMSSDLKLLDVVDIGINFGSIMGSGLGRRASYIVASNFAKKSASLSFRYYAWDVDDTTDFQVMVASGFTMMSGKAIGEPTTSPVATYFLPNNAIMKPTT